MATIIKTASKAEQSIQSKIELYDAHSTIERHDHAEVSGT